MNYADLNVAGVEENKKQPELLLAIKLFQLTEQKAMQEIIQDHGVSLQPLKLNNLIIYP
jgi:hypothetical protein